MTGNHWHLFLLRHTAGNRLRLAAGAALVISQILVLAAIPWPTKLAVDFVLADRRLPDWLAWIERLPFANTQAGLLTYLGVGIVGLAVAHAGLRVGQRVWRRSLGLRLTHQLAGHALNRVQQQSLLSLSQREMRSGDIVQRVVADTKSIDTLLFGVWFTVFESVMTLLLLGGVIALMTGSLVGVALLLVVPMLFATKFYRDRLEIDAENLAESQGNVSSGVEEMLSNVAEIQAFAAERAELARFRGDLDKQLDASLAYQRTSLGFGLATSSVTAIGTGVIMYLGGLQVLDGSLTLGELLVFLSYLAAIYAPVEGLAYVTQSLATARAGALRVMELTRADHRLTEANHPVSLSLEGRGATVSFENVNMAYREDQPVLKNISLEIPAGQWVALVGGSGAGKTTLASMIPRLYDATEGVVRINGVDVRDARLQETRRAVSLAQQDPLLLPVSVRDNIRYGTPAATDAQVAAAAEAALCTSFIAALPEGFDTVIGERGVTLSGGQRQRLAIARALCRDAPVLILDEPTAALDAESEAVLLERLRRAADGRTVLMVAHRLSTVRRADRVIVLEQGTVVEDGTHAELLAHGGVYHRYLSLQSTPRGG